MVRLGEPPPVGTGRPRAVAPSPMAGRPGAQAGLRPQSRLPCPVRRPMALPAALLRWRACPLLVLSQFLFQTLPPTSFLPESIAVLVLGMGCPCAEPPARAGPAGRRQARKRSSKRAGNRARVRAGLRVTGTGGARGKELDLASCGFIICFSSLL